MIDPDMIRCVQKLRGPWTFGSRIYNQYLVEGLLACRPYIRGVLLDVGCGKKPYQKLLGNNVTWWIGLDKPVTYSGRPDADACGNGLALPFQAETFDTVLCTQVLEHVTRPHVLMYEICRVLRPRGHLVLSAPQTNPLHEAPHDYFRFTRYGLECLAQEAGLRVIRLENFGGALACLGQLLANHVPLLRRPRRLGEIVRGVIQAAVQWPCFHLDRLIPVPESTIGYLLVAEKGGEGMGR